MSATFIVGYDGSPSARNALDFTIKQAKPSGGKVVIAHILEWSPYSFLTPTELEERHKRREEELSRAEQAVLEPIVKAVKESGVNVETELKYGHIAQTLVDIATSHSAEQIIIGRTGHSGLSSRLFGSVAGSLAQASPVAVTIVP